MEQADKTGRTWIRKIWLTVAFLAFVFCGCGTTPHAQNPGQETTQHEPESVTIGGEVQIRMQHLK